MTTLISAAAYAASQSLAVNGQSIKRSHISEVLAALLGYQTYAALVLEERDDRQEYHLDDAEMLVLNTHLAKQRLDVLGLSHIVLVLPACVSALKGAASVPVYQDLAHFYDAYARQIMVEAISSSDEVSAAMTETNAHFDDEAELPYTLPPTENLWEARSNWSIEASGDLVGDHDIDGDRMFAGDTLTCLAKLMFDKAGRAGLIFVDSEAYGGVDESWREIDRANEALYLEGFEAPDLGPGADADSLPHVGSPK